MLHSCVLPCDKWDYPDMQRKFFLENVFKEQYFFHLPHFISKCDCCHSCLILKYHLKIIYTYYAAACAATLLKYNGQNKAKATALGKIKPHFSFSHIVKVILKRLLIIGELKTYHI